jgi:hypothetical protein
MDMMHTPRQQLRQSKVSLSKKGKWPPRRA